MAKYTPKTTEELKALVQDESIYLGDIDTSAIMNMNALFEESERKDFSGIESWDVSNVRLMASMFRKAKYFNHNINSWDVLSVIDMSGMFSLAESFNQPLDKWDTSNVVDMRSMFANAKNFNQPLDSWDVSSVVNMNSMFMGAVEFNQPLDSWDTSSVKFMTMMFWAAKSFKQNLNAWNVDSVEDNQQMFWHSGVESLPKWWKKRIKYEELRDDNSIDILVKMDKEVEMGEVAQALKNPRSKEERQREKEQKQREKEQAKQQKAWFKPKAENSAENQAEQGKNNKIYTYIGYGIVFLIGIVILAYNINKINERNEARKARQSAASTQRQTPPKPTIAMPSCDDNGVKQYINDTQRQGVRQKLQSDADAWASVQAHARASGRDFASIDEYMNSLIFYFSSTQTTSRDEAAQCVECSAQVLADFPFPQARFELKYNAQITPQGTRVDVTNAQLLNQAPEISSVASDATENVATSSSAPSESVNSSENLNVASESAQSAIKPSFDCAKASSRAEKLVCSDSELASLDLQRIRALQSLSSVRLKTSDEYVNLRKAPSGEVLTPIYKKDFDKITIKRLDGGDAKWLKVLYFPSNVSDESKAITGYIHISQIDKSSL